MRYALAVLAAAVAVLALSACETQDQYDGVSRFAERAEPASAYYGPGSPPRDFDGAEPRS